MKQKCGIDKDAVIVLLITFRMPLIGSVMSSTLTSGLLIGKGGVVVSAPKLSTGAGEAVEK